MTHPVRLDSPAAIEQHLIAAIPVDDIESGGVRFIVCDTDAQVLMHAQVGAPSPDDPAPDDGLGDGPDATIARFVPLVSEATSLGSLLVALTRLGPSTVTPVDRRCFQTAQLVCAEQQVRLLGVHVVTPRGQRAVVLDDL